MKLKTLLLGSAAALIAVSGARAADAVVAEPEPVDYVKVCDMYGAGFFYIPGTERCLKISGEIRVQYEYQDFDYDLAANDRTEGDGYWHARVNLDAREETDWGTLRTYIRLEGDGDNDDDARDNWGALDAYIELGGLSTGYRTSRHELTGLPGAMHDGRYFGGGRVMYFDYTYAANGLSVVGGISLDNGAIPTLTVSDESVDGYIRADYSGSMFNIGAVYSHDTSAEEGAWGVYGNVAPLDGLLIQAYFNSQEDSTQYGGAGGDTQAWGVGASYKVMDNVQIVGGFYNWDSELLEVDGYTLGVNWNVEPNLVVRVDYNHEEQDIVGGLDRDVTDYRIRIQSNF